MIFEIKFVMVYSYTFWNTIRLCCVHNSVHDKCVTLVIIWFSLFFFRDDISDSGKFTGFVIFFRCCSGLTEMPKHLAIC